MKFLGIFLLYLSLLPFLLPGQITNLNLKCKLPQNLSETSGLLTLNEGITFWTHNDSGGEACLYEFDSECQILRKVFINNAPNVDWEEITADEKGNVYIGDFGNNSNNRTDLKIYRLNNFINNSRDSITAEIINFNYFNQSEFPPPVASQNFDMEAMIVIHDSVFLFSKNRTNPFSGYTHLHTIPASPGTHTTILLDSFYTGQGLNQLFWVTGASISHDHKKLILLSYDKAWMFYPLNLNDFFNSQLYTLQFNSISQKEGIYLTDDFKIWLTDEYYSLFQNGGTLMQGDLSKLINQTVQTQNNLKLVEFNITTKELSSVHEKMEYLIIYNMFGQSVLKTKFPQGSFLNLSDLPIGPYVLMLMSKEIIYVEKILIH